MILFTAVLAAVALQGPDWTWTLYEGEGPLVLAHEIVDTPQLSSTLECAPGSGAVKVSVYGGDLVAGFATVAAGDAEATAQAEAGQGKASLALRTDHPAFLGFVTSGRMTISIGGHDHSITVEPDHLAKLRRFAQLCGG